MSIQDYILAAKPLVPLTITGQSDWDSAPEIGVIGGGKLGPKILTDREILSASGWTFSPSYMARDTGTASTSAGMSPADYPFWAGASYANRATAPVRITPAGSMFLGDPTSNPYLILNGSNVDIGTSDYVSGVTGWRIHPLYAEFANAFIRGELHSTIFVKDLIDARAGTLIVAKSAGKLSSNTTIPAAGTWTITIDDAPGGGFLFANSDICRMQAETASGVASTWFTVSGRVDNGDGTQTYTCTYASGTLSVIYTIGSPVIDYGVSGDGFLLMTADLASPPYYDVLTHAGAPWTTTTIKARLGNLAGVTDATLNPTGYGLYTTNGYFSGTVVSTTGTIGGWSIGASSITDTAGVVGMSSAVTGGDDIRFWAGDATPASAEFRVTESGALTATSATITGSITATSGAIGGWTIGATTLAGGDVTLDSTNGIAITEGTVADPNVLSWKEGATVRGRLYTYKRTNDHLTWLATYGATGTLSTSGIMACVSGDTNEQAQAYVAREETTPGADSLVFSVDFYKGGVLSRIPLRAGWDEIANGNDILLTDALFYPGTGVAIQNDRYIADNGANIVVDSVVVATHTHTGGAGGTVAWSSIDKATSSIADITTKSAGALDSGNLAFARLPTGSGTWSIGALLSLQLSQDSGVITEVKNLNTGTAAYAGLRCVADNGAGGSNNFTMLLLGGGYTTSGKYVAETGLIESGSGVTGGIIISSIANAPIDFYSNNAKVGRINATGLYPGNQTTHYITGGASGIGIDVAPAQLLELSGGNISLGREAASTTFTRYIGLGGTAGDMVPGSSGGCQIGFNTSGTGAGQGETITFLTHSPGVSHAVRMTIDNVGNIRFHAYGAGALSTDASGNITASDARLKDIQRPFARGLADLLKLSPVVYRWTKESGCETENEYAAFTAQDVQRAIPEAVVGARPDGMLNYSDRTLIAVLVNAIKENHTRIARLEAQVGTQD